MVAPGKQTLAQIFLSQGRRVSVFLLLFVLSLGLVLALLTQRLSTGLGDILLSYQNNGIADEIVAQLKSDKAVDIEHLSYLLGRLPEEGEGLWHLRRDSWLESLSADLKTQVQTDDERREIVLESLKLDSSNEVIDLETSFRRIREILWSARVSHPGIVELQLVLELRQNELAFLSGEEQPGFPDMSRSPHLQSLGESASFLPKTLWQAMQKKWPVEFEPYEMKNRLQIPLRLEGQVLGVLRVELSDRQALRVVKQQTQVFVVALVLSSVVLGLLFVWLAAKTRRMAELWVAQPLQGLSGILGDVDADGDGHIARQDIDGVLPALESFQKNLQAASEIHHITKAARQHLELLSDTLAENEAIQEKLKDALARLEEASAVLVQSSKGWMMAELGAWVAHDLNNKLQGAYSISSNWIEREKPCPVKHLKFLHLSLEKALEQVDQFSQLSKPQSGDRVEKVSADALFEDLKLLVSQRVQQAGVELKVDVEKELQYLNVAPGKMQDMLMNLIFNGCDAIEEKGESGSITVIAQGSTISVEDTGVGIAESEQAELFNRPFFSTKEDSGSGLGLRIVASVATELKGRVECQSALGEGAKFTVTLGAEHVQGTESQS